MHRESPLAKAMIFKREYEEGGLVDVLGELFRSQSVFGFIEYREAVASQSFRPSRASG